MRVTFELSDRDLRYFKRIMNQARDKVRERDEREIKDKAVSLLRQLDDVDVSDFVRERLSKLQAMIRMLEDSEWELSGKDRAHVVDALAYFAEPEDLIPDRIPALGYLDDAIMIELIARELRDDLEAYADFCEFRINEEQRRGTTEDPLTREEWLKARRQQLHARMRRRRDRRRSSVASGSGGSPFGLW
jgi:uncharacterized membrane protein YkvA (DUF1232 family)